MMNKVMSTAHPLALKRLAMLAAISVTATGFEVYAQDQTPALEEIIVTGTKREVAQQDLGMSVSTLTENQIKNSFITDVTAVTQLAPNVNILQQNGFNAVGGGIRGTGFISILVTKDPSVGVTVDDFAFNHVQSQFVELFDVEQVEVFRGPAGTLFGQYYWGGNKYYDQKARPRRVFRRRRGAVRSV